MIFVIGPVTNASLNPARSLATAIFEGGTAMTQLWFFVAFPIIGGVLAGLMMKCCCCGDAYSPAACDVNNCDTGKCCKK